MNLIGNKFDKFDLLYSIGSAFLYVCSTVFTFNGFLDYLKENVSYLSVPIMYLIAIAFTIAIVIPFSYWLIRMHKSNRSKSAKASENYFLMMEIKNFLTKMNVK